MTLVQAAIAAGAVLWATAMIFAVAGIRIGRRARHSSRNRGEIESPPPETKPSIAQLDNIPPHIDQKTEALGRLTGGIAHEFNNLLTIILGNAEILKFAAEARGNDLDIRRIGAIEIAAQRGGRLATQLLAFSRKQSLRPRTLSVYMILSEMNDLLSRAAGDAVQVRLVSAPELSSCHVDLGQLEAAILNLVLNASDAMPSGGVVTINCRNRAVTPAQAEQFGGQPGDYVRVEVTDTGIGIPPDIQKKVFEPFFTTKPFGTASGLGLSQVHGFVGQSGGWVELTSEVGRGTTVAMLLPCAPIQAADNPPVRASPPSPIVEQTQAEREQLYTEAREHSGLAEPAASIIVAPARRPGGNPAEVPSPQVPHHNAVRIGVLPLRTIGGSASGETSLGLAEELTTALSRFRGIACIAPASVAALAGRPLTDTEHWGADGLDYVIDGSFRQHRNQIRVTIRLVNLRQSGEVSWSKRFDGEFTDILALQDHIAAETAAQVAPELLMWEGRNAASRPQVNASSYDLMLRAIPAVFQVNQAEFRAAGDMLRQSVALDDSNAAAHSWLAHWYMLLIGQGWAADADRTADSAQNHATRAILLDPCDARGLTIAGHIKGFLYKQPVAAMRLHAQALELNPNLALAWCYSGLAHSYAGRHPEAIEQIRQAQRLSPHDPHAFFFDMAMVMPLIFTGDYDNATRVGRRAHDANPTLSSTHKGLLCALGLIGAVDEAAELRKELIRLEPGFCVRSALERSPLTQSKDLERYATGLRLAGCRERPGMLGRLDIWKPPGFQRQTSARYATQFG